MTGMTPYCSIRRKFVNDRECDLCDIKAGMEIGTWRNYGCPYRKPRHPIYEDIHFWLFSWPPDLETILYKFLIIVTRIGNIIAKRLGGSFGLMWSSETGWKIEYYKTGG